MADIKDLLSNLKIDEIKKSLEEFKRTVSSQEEPPFWEYNVNLGKTVEEYFHYLSGCLLLKALNTGKVVYGPIETIISYDNYDKLIEYLKCIGEIRLERLDPDEISHTESEYLFVSEETVLYAGFIRNNFVPPVLHCKLIFSTLNKDKHDLILKSATKEEFILIRAI